MITGTHDAETKGEAELYETPPGATRALIAAEPYLQRPRRILEPACGPGAIVEVLEAAGHQVTAGDKFDYSARWKAAAASIAWGRDFLSGDALSYLDAATYDAVVMNPPYSQADEFVFNALPFAPRIYALLELGWPQGALPVRTRLTDGGHLVRQLTFRERLDMHRDGFPEEERGSSTRKHAWFVFSRRPLSQGEGWQTLRISQTGG